MRIKCSVRSCSSTKKLGTRMFSLPQGIRNQIRANKWLKALGYESYKIHKRVEVCENHFCRQDFDVSCKYSKNRLLRLKPSAIPHLLLETNTQMPCNSTVLESMEPNADKICIKNSPEDMSIGMNSETNLFLKTNAQSEKVDSDIICTENTFLKIEIAELKREIFELKTKNKLLEDELQKIKTCVDNDQISLSKNVRRWSTGTISKSLKIRLACGSIGYDTLREIGYPLPAQRTLRRRIEHLKFQPGILDEVLNALKPKIELMRDEEKHCALILDEMALTPKYDFDASTGFIIGKPTIPSSNKEFEELATHGLTYMIAGVTSRWKQVVGYQLTGNSFDSDSVINDIFCLIKKIEMLGLQVDIVISDMGGQNQAIWRQLGISGRRYETVKGNIEHPNDSRRALFFSPDPPHILKNLRDHLTRQQIIYLPEYIVEHYQFQTNEINIKYIESLLEIDSKKELKMAPYLNINCIRPSHFEKMKVGLALQLLHHDTGAAIRYCVAEELMPNTAIPTAWFCETMYQWFKLITSRNKTLALSFNIKENYKNATTFLRDIIKLFENIKIGKDGVFYWKPVQTGILLSTTNALNLAEYYLTSKGFNYVCLGRFTQDVIENLFSQIRFINPVPSPKFFKMALRLISIAQFFKTNERGNYEVDDSWYLANFLEIEKPALMEVEDQVEIDYNKLSEDYFSELEQSEEQSLYYLAGHLINNLEKQLKCSKCLKFLKTSAKDDDVKNLKKLQDLKAISGKLVYASR